MSIESERAAPDTRDHQDYSVVSVKLRTFGKGLAAGRFGSPAAEAERRLGRGLDR